MTFFVLVLYTIEKNWILFLLNLFIQEVFNYIIFDFITYLTIIVNNLKF